MPVEKDRVVLMQSKNNTIWIDLATNLIHKSDIGSYIVNNNCLSEEITLPEAPAMFTTKKAS